MAALAASKPAYALLWTATVASTPERPLGDLWRSLDQLSAYMVSGSWLGSRVDGYVRSIEVERKPGGWHPHAHWLLVFRNELSCPDAVKLAQEIQARYLRAADLRGIAAGIEGQDVRVVPLSQLSEKVNYITKQHMTTKPSKTPMTVTPAMLLRSAYQGNADALDLLHELERVTYRRRTWQPGGMLRHSIAASA